jgi:hypothetical protein
VYSSVEKFPNDQFFWFNFFCVDKFPHIDDSVVKMKKVRRLDRIGPKVEVRQLSIFM